MRRNRHDEGAAATELGYVFTFLLGVVLLSMFGVWAYGIETATRERWNATAIQANLPIRNEAAADKLGAGGARFPLKRLLWQQV